MKIPRWTTKVAVAAAIMGGTADISPASAATTQCRQRAIDFCSANWQEAFSSQNECITTMTVAECQGQNPQPGGPNCWAWFGEEVGWQIIGNYPYQC